MSSPAIMAALRRDTGSELDTYVRRLVEVVIDAGGEVQIEVRGIKGRACLEPTEDRVDALSGEVREREFTAEADEEPSGVAAFERKRAHSKSASPLR